jgi:hypothetical protein
LLHLRRRVLSHPQPMIHVISPVSGRPVIQPVSPKNLRCVCLDGNLQFGNNNFLHDIPRHGVEDEKQGLVGEAANLGVNGLGVNHGVAIR